MKSTKRKFNVLDWLIIVMFCLAVVFFSVFTIKNTIISKSEHAKHIEDLYGNISFSGRVVDFHYVKHSGMPTAAIMCIKIDSSNVDSFYQYDKYTALKIENGMVTLPIGGCGPSNCGPEYESIIYVAVNENRSHEMRFINEANDTLVRTLYYTSENLKEYDLGICDSCRNEE